MHVIFITNDTHIIVSHQNDFVRLYDLRELKITPNQKLNWTVGATHASPLLSLHDLCMDSASET